MKPWKVLRLQSRYEFFVERQLVCLGIEHYLPKLEERRKWSDRIKKQLVPAFPNYIFVSSEEKRRNDVFLVRGVLSYVRFEQRDAVIREEEMEMIRRLEPYCSQKAIVSLPERGVQMRIRKGLLNGQLGRIVDWKGRKVVCIELEEMRQGFLLELPLEYLALA